MAARSPSFWASRACWSRPRPACSAPTGFWPPTSRPTSAAPCRETGKVDIDAARKIYAELSQQADDWLAKEKVAPADRKQTRVALMRYHGQGGEVSVGWVDDAAGVEAAFAAAHESLYGFKLEAPIELVTLRIEATGRMPAPLRPVLRRRQRAQSRKAATPSISLRERPRCRSTIAPRCGAGDRIDGPAIVSQLDATTLVAPGWSGEVHPSGAILLKSH